MLACSFTNFYLVLCQLASRKHVMTCPIREYVYMGSPWGGSGCLDARLFFTNFYLVLCQLASRKHVMTCPIREYVYMGWGGCLPFGDLGSSACWFFYQFILGTLSTSVWKTCGNYSAWVSGL